MKIRTFSNHRRSLRLALALTAAATTMAVPVNAGATEPEVPGSCKLHHNKVVNPGCVPALSEEVTGYEITYPDLVPNVKDIAVSRPIFWDPETTTVANGPPELAFDTHAQNFGTVPVDLLTDDATDRAGSTVSQCIAWTTDFVCRERRQVGGFIWHNEHSHFHFQDFGHYELRRTLADGTTDYSAAGLVDVSEKVSFCLMDSDTAREDAFPVARYRQCDAINQGVSPGWTDIYGSFLPGQQFPLTGVPDGRYVLVIDMDTADHVYESDESNNRLELTFDVTTSPDSVVIVSRAYS